MTRKKVMVTCPTCKEERLSTPTNRFDKSTVKLCRPCAVKVRKHDFKVGKALTSE